MNLNINNLLFILCVFFYSSSSYADLQELVRRLALNNGYKQPESTYRQVNMQEVLIGKELFESTSISLNAEISCSTCHIKQFGLSDGLPNSVGIGADGESFERFRSGGQIIPRNSLSLLGSGSVGYKSFFWDGRVIDNGEAIMSPFSNDLPSTDPLVVAIHLPAAEIRETIAEDLFVASHKTESTNSATKIYSAITDKLKKEEKDLMLRLSEVKKIDFNELSFADVATSIASMIRYEFRLTESKFSRFMKNEQVLTEGEIEGALLFYGKGRCSSCHNGPYFSDFDFHTIAMPQAGFGKNGFGVDYGLYNSTFNPKDLYRFRTPVLHNVTKTAPYGHSGSLYNLSDAIISHVDPLSLFSFSESDAHERMQFLQALLKIDLPQNQSSLSINEIKLLELFLKTLEIDSHDA